MILINYDEAGFLLKKYEHAKKSKKLSLIYKLREKKNVIYNIIIVIYSS